MKTVSKWGVKHHRIQAGDLIEYEYQQIQGDNHLGYVTKVDHDKREITAFWSDDLRESSIYYNHDHEPIVGHWKVINFEEEDKMDELKVYTGKETVKALLEGKVLKEEDYGTQYKIKDDEFLAKPDNSKGWKASILQFDGVLKFKFTEVVTPQVGDWVKVIAGENTFVGKLTKTENELVWAFWNKNTNETWLNLSYYPDWEILSPEQVSEYKREQAFVKVGRKLNEFKADDIVFVDGIGEVAVVISKENSGEFIKIHLINKAHGLKAKPHQIRPISFVEHQVNLD